MSEEFINEGKRSQVIQIALTRLKRKNEEYIQRLETHPKWRKIYNGLLFNNVQADLNKLFGLALCQVNNNEDASFFSPFEKTPITICYNKINKEEVFQTHAIYNLVLLYDSRVRKDMNWNDLAATAKSTVRALHISEICKRNDRECFQKQLEKRVLKKDRFNGMVFNFEEAYQAGVEDMIPISQVGLN